jgi:hypothetical protein
LAGESKLLTTSDLTLSQPKQLFVKPILTSKAIDFHFGAKFDASVQKLKTN